ncbi:hypothetical protein [Metabacillus fastidiosus]|nr:hypothetical protein [Metabacillus fastidiosus]MEC2078391.1 hypothetical protein [Metabacillus fastidiosus]MED4531226.1 hypothetical protein [Metabacillus fastidiosus]
MRKKLLAILLASLLGTIITGCNEINPGTDQPGEDEIGDDEVNDEE